MIQLLLRLFIVFRKFRGQLLLDLFDQRIALELGMLLRIERVGEVCADLLFKLVVVRIIELRRLDLRASASLPSRAVR